MNDGTKRIEILVVDLLERMGLPQDIRIRRNNITLYTGSVIRVPKEFLNEKVILIYTHEYSTYLYIVIE